VLGLGVFGAADNNVFIDRATTPTFGNNGRAKMLQAHKICSVPIPWDYGLVSVT
jgi:hypothetical protein